MLLNSYFTHSLAFCMKGAVKASRTTKLVPNYPLEMSRLDVEDAAGRRTPAVDGFDVSEDGSAFDDDEVDVALLNTETRLRGRDPSEEKGGSMWSKIRDIVIEVRGLRQMLWRCSFGLM